MPRNGVYDVPRNFAGEDRYLKYFSKRSIIFLIIGAAIWVGLGYISNMTAYPWIGIVTGGIITAILVALSTIKVPRHFYIYGGGVILDRIILRVIKRKFNKVIYTKCTRRE